MASFPQAEIHQVNVNGETFWLRELSLGDWDELYPRAEKPDPEPGDGEEPEDGGDAGAEDDLGEDDESRSWHILKLTLVHEDGRRATEEEVLKVPVRFAAALIRQALLINGLGVTDKALRGNSAGQARD